MSKKNGKKSHLKFSEQDIRVTLTKNLVKQYRDQNPIFAIEARYGFGDRRADFVMVNEFTHAFEIKSDVDTLNRLEEQLSEYVSTFDFITVVTTTMHLKNVRSLCNSKVGIIVFDNFNLSKVRAAQQNKRLSKPHLAASLSKRNLINALQFAKRKTTLAELKQIAIETLTISELRELFVQELKSRFSRSSEQFFQETDDEIHEEDLLLLRRSMRLFQ